LQIAKTLLAISPNALQSGGTKTRCQKEDFALAEKYPVVIVGAGPVGLALAWMLIEQLVPVEVYEALPELSQHDRANTFHPPVLELFKEWGILEVLLAQGETVHELQYWKRETRSLVAAFDFALIKPFTPYPFRLHLPQYRLTRALEPLQVGSGRGALYFSHRLANLEDQGTHVEAVFSTAHGERRVQASYLCAADGARSQVRQNLGVDFVGKTITDRFLLVDTDAHLDRLFTNIGPVSYIFDPEEWVIAQRMKGTTRFTFRVHAHEDAGVATSPALMYERVDRFAPGLTHNVRHAAVYEIQQRVATTFRIGRVLLVGDAAHVTNPIGGKGLNSGILDAHDLAGKLARVMAGEAPALLDTYNQIRRQVALDYLNPTTEAEYADMTADTHHAITNRDEKFQEIATDLTLARNFLLRVSMLEDRLSS
jgi:3-(3-hydroxy-phenyl)propionate hydroxylase